MGRDATVAARGEPPVELGRFGPLPIAKGWNVIDRGTVPNKTGEPLEWIVFTNKETKEHLSIASFPAQRTGGGNAIFLADTSG